MTTEQEEFTQPPLGKKQIKYLRGLGHKLPALVLVGKEGLSTPVFEAVNVELKRHELIKVKIGNNSSVKKGDAAEIIPEKAQCHLVQLIGKTLLLYKENPKIAKEKRIILPKK